MKKGERHSISGVGIAWNCGATVDPEGPWLYDPDKETISRDVAIAANARADCYEEQMLDMAMGFDKLEKRNLKLLASLESAEEKVGFLENQVTDLANFLEEKKRQLKSLIHHSQGGD